MKFNTLFLFTLFGFITQLEATQTFTDSNGSVWKKVVIEERGYKDGILSVTMTVEKPKTGLNRFIPGLVEITVFEDKKANAMIMLKLNTTTLEERLQSHMKKLEAKDLTEAESTEINRRIVSFRKQINSMYTKYNNSLKSVLPNHFGDKTEKKKDNMELAELLSRLVKAKLISKKMAAELKQTIESKIK